jgi:hypothetical protein
MVCLNTLRFVLLFGDRQISNYGTVHTLKPARYDHYFFSVIANCIFNEICLPSCQFSLSRPLDFSKSEFHECIDNLHFPFYGFDFLFSSSACSLCYQTAFYFMFYDIYVTFGFYDCLMLINGAHRPDCV